MNKIRKCIPAGWNKCLPHAQMSGTHNLQYYLNHLEFCGRKARTSSKFKGGLRHLRNQEALGEVIERKCTHSKAQSERWKSTKRRKQNTALNKTGY